MTRHMKYQRAICLFLMFSLGLVWLSSSLLHPAPLKAQDSEEQPTVCAVNEVQINGQDWVHPGGGSAITQDVDVTDPEGVVDYTTVIPANTSGGRVLILVLDDFKNKDLTSGLTHGYVVYRIAQILLALAGPSQHTVFFVNIPEYDLTGIDTVLRNQIEGASSLGYTHVVLNMSFALAPCEFRLAETEEPISIPSFIEVYNRSDSIVEILDVDPDTPTNQAGWEVVRFTPDSQGEELPLQVGDIITGFRDADLDPENCTAHNHARLWGFIKDEAPDSILTVCIMGEEGTVERQVRASQLFTAIRGYSIAQNLAQLETLEPPEGVQLTLEFWENQIKIKAAQVNITLLNLPQDILNVGPLFNLLTNLPTGPVVIPVSAAGNYGHLVAATTPSPTATPTPTPTPTPIPTTTPVSTPGGALVPGSWPMVINVSGSTANEPLIKWEYSNNGEVLVPALWYHVDNWYVAGTSFAAPVASVLIGLKAAADPSFIWQDCADADGSNKAYANRPIADVLSTTSSPITGCP